MEKIFCILKTVPLLAFTLFSVLIFIFYIAPVAVVPEIGESFGSVYSMTNGILSEVPELTGGMITLIILAVLSLLCASVIWVVMLSKETKFKRFKFFGKEMKLSAALEFSSFVFYFIFFLIGCIICGKIAAFDEGMGIIAAGACPVLVLVFSIIFAFVSAGSLVARSFIKKNFPQYVQREEKRERARFENYKAEIEELVKAGAPTEPQKVEKPKVPSKPSKIVKSKIRVAIFVFVFIIFALLAFLVQILSVDLSTTQNGFSSITLYYLNVSAIVVSASAPFVALIIGALIRVKKLKTERYCKRGLLIATAVLCSCAIVAFCLVLGLAGVTEINDSYYGYAGATHDISGQAIYDFVVTGIIALCGLISLLYNIIVIIKIKRIQKNSAVFEELNIQIEEYYQSKADYATYLNQYAEYKKQSKKYKRVVKKYNSLSK